MRFVLFALLLTASASAQSAADSTEVGTVVGTVMSNLGFERALNAAGIDLVRTQVGDRYVVEAMREGGFNLGGEQSGHVVLLDHTTTGDGLIAALQVMRVMVEEGYPLSRLAATMQRVPQVLKGVMVRAKPPLETLPKVTKLMGRIARELEGTGRILVRYSGTEKKCRVMLEGDDMERIEGFASEVAEAIAQEIGDE